MASIPVLAGQEMDEGLEEMWHGSAQGIHAIDAATENWRNQKLPLAKIKKIMKSEDVILQELERDKQEKLAAEEGQAATTVNEKSTKFMISGEAPVLMSKACELMIKDLSFRAWRHTERNRRRTLQKQDLHAAVGESEVYDFLIDIVPRVTTTTPKMQHTHAHVHAHTSHAHSHLPASAAVAGTGMMPPAIPVGMQVGVPGGMPVGLPAAALPQHTTQPGAIDHNPAGIMQLMGTAQHQVHQQQQQHQHQQHQPTQFHQDPSQQQQQQHVVGAQQPPQVPQNMHPQVQQQHMQQTYVAMPQLLLGPPAGGAPVAMPTPGAAPAYDPNLAATTTPTTTSHAEAPAPLPPQWPAVTQPES